MVRILSILALTFSATLAYAQTDEELRKKPVTTDNGPVGKLLKQWYAEGTAAGNVGDWYDNRDREHSPLNMSVYPQLQKVTYSEEDLKLKRDWALQPKTLPHVTFGNSSTSAPPLSGGSNPRMYYSSQQGLSIIYNHYIKNNLYIFPEHRDHDPGPPRRLGENKKHSDHDPGRNGRGPGREEGWGDLYPTNTPYLLISQGSSGSDQPFMNAIPYTLAAFRPEVKQKLAETGLLMPTLQLLLRSSNKHLKDAGEYLTGKAHPTVFEGSWVDPLKMVQQAHALTLETLPPLVKLKVLEEDVPQPGRDFFDRAPNEKLADTPQVIARIWRGKERQRKLIVSAAESQDLNKKPLTFSWVVLRGDPERIKITPRDDKTSAEIVVQYHERRPIAPGAVLASNRVDIGVFAHNGTHYSAPAFLTWFALDSEARSYDAQGRIAEIGYDHGEVQLRVQDWVKLLAQLAEKEKAGHFTLTPAMQQELQQASAEYSTSQHTVKETQRRLQGFEGTRKERQADVAKADEQHKKAAKQNDDMVKLKAQAELAQAKTALAQADEDVQRWQKAVQEAQQLGPKLLAKARPGFQEGLERFVENHVLAPPRESQELLTKLDTLLGKEPPAALKPLLQQLTTTGIAELREGRLQLLPKGATAKQLTEYQRTQLTRLYAALLQHIVLPGTLGSDYRVHYVDHRLTVQRSWRDVYRWRDDGTLLGWTRWDESGARDFNAAGQFVLERDALGRCAKARTVLYPVESQPGAPFRGVLRTRPGPVHVTYEYAGPQDFVGRESRREPVAESAPRSQ